MNLPIEDQGLHAIFEIIQRNVVSHQREHLFLVSNDHGRFGLHLASTGNGQADKTATSTKLQSVHTIQSAMIGP